MFKFFRKKKDTMDIFKDNDKKNKEERSAITIGTGFAATKSAQVSTQAAAQKFAKPDQYNRKLLDNGIAKKNIKLNAFNSNNKVYDPYTGKELCLTKAETQQKYGNAWLEHLAEADHKISLKQRYEETKNNPWLSNDDIKASSNSLNNLEVISRKYNNAKRDRSNKIFVTDDEYLKKTGLNLSKEAKAKAIKSEKQAQKALRKQDFKDITKNIVQTGHNAGKAAAKDAGATGITMSGIMNIIAYMKGEKSGEDALTDTIKDGGKSAITGYAMGNGLTTLSHTLSNSSSEFLRALSKSTIPGEIITAIMMTGNTLKRYGEGEISTQECLLELGEKGINCAIAAQCAVAGQALIPIPVIGAVVGTLVGSIITSSYCNELMLALKNKELEHQERLRIMEECEKAKNEALNFREELETYLEAYFQDYKKCFDEALSTIYLAFKEGDADGVVCGANQITQKLGGKVYYNNRKEFREFLINDEVDIL